MIALCLLSRHQAVALVMGQGSEKGWYHAGSFIQTCVESQIVARFVPCFFATFSILMVFPPISSTQGPLVGLCKCINSH